MAEKTTAEIIAIARASQRRAAYRQYGAPTVHRGKMVRKGFTGFGLKVVKWTGGLILGASLALSVVSVGSEKAENKVPATASFHETENRVSPNSQEIASLEKVQEGSKTLCWLEYHNTSGGWFEPICQP
jgi:hypothetical protein